MIEQHIQEIQKIIGADFLNLYLSLEFNSNNALHRSLIRSEIIKNHSPQLSQTEIHDISNLDFLPTSENIFFSISHHHSLGGYSASTERHGFDVELKSRITDPTILRVSTRTDVFEAPDLKFLWCAKEASYKAIGNKNLIISDLNIGHWVSQNKTGLWSFRLTSAQSLVLKHNMGFIFCDQQQIFSLFFA